MKKENVIIYLLIVVILVLTGYICVDKLYIDKNADNKITESNKQDKVENDQESNIKEIQIDSEEVKKAMESFEGIIIKKDNLYENNTYDISSITNYELVATAVNHVEGKYIEVCGSPKTANDNVTYEMLNKYLNNYVLNKKITKNTIDSLEKEFPQEEGYNFYEIGKGLNISNNTINITEGCHGKYIEDYIDTKLIKAEKDSNYLYIYEKQAYATYETIDNYDTEDGRLLVDYYKDYTKKVLVQKLLDSSESVIDDKIAKSTPNWDLYNTYKYTFKIVDGNYYFQKLELV